MTDPLIVEAKDLLASANNPYAGRQEDMIRRLVARLEDEIASHAESLSNDKKKIDAAINMGFQYGGIDGGHHKMWVIDRMIRILTDCPSETTVFERGHKFVDYGESEEYKRLVRESCGGEDGPNTYEWDTGCAP